MLRMELRRKGAFTTTYAAPKNEGRCGSENANTYLYEVVIRCDSSQLDDNDFVYDHNKIGTYFQDTFGREPIILSCEMMAMRSVKHFHNELKRRGIDYIEVNVLASDVSHRAIWDKSKTEYIELPDANNPLANLGQKWADAA